MKDVAAVVLAAGASSRLGQPKQLLEWDGKPLIAHVTGIPLAAGLRPVIVVLGYGAREVGQVLSARFGDQIQRAQVRVAVNWNWHRGMGGSIRAGLAVLPPETEAAVFIQADQPSITPDLLRALVSRFSGSETSIVHPTLAGERRPPVLFARRLFPELAALTGDQGGRAVIDDHPHEIATVQVDAADVLADIDTPADYERLRKRVASRQHHAGSPESKGDLTRIRHLIIDMDGVLWNGSTAVPGLQELFEFLREQGIDFLLATNNSSLMPRQYSDKLARFGVEIPPERILTSSEATAGYVAGLAAPGTRVFVVGGDGIRHALEKRGFVLTRDDAQIVVVGWDRQLTWDKLATAALLIHGGAQFIGTNPDNSYPAEQGPVPGNGAQLAALQATTGACPVVVGKPEPWLYREAMRRMDASPRTTATVGDRLETDVVGGQRAGLTTILVLSGIATKEDLAEAPATPDLVCSGIRELVQVWQDQLRARTKGQPTRHTV